MKAYNPLPLVMLKSGKYSVQLVLIIVLGFTNTFSQSVQSIIPEKEREALIALYEATNGDLWWNNEGWKSNGAFNVPGSEGSWYGVTVQGQSVVEIQLTRIRLEGEIPDEIGDFQHLRKLSLEGNNLLTGIIPKSMGNLSRLEILNLYANSLSGEIPAELGNLSELTFLDLLANGLEGGIPSEIGNLSNLQVLRLSSNKLSGNIPATLGNLSNLKVLLMYANDFDGEIPPELGNLSNLEELLLYGYKLSPTLGGQIPPELGNLSNLTKLMLYGNNLSGKIPTELGQLSNLKELRLYNNNLSGDLPVELGNLMNLEALRLHNNNLTGEIPVELGNLTELGYLELFNNNLEGKIPGEIGNLSKLIRLNVSNNNLGGNIPPELGNLSNLRDLNLSSNKLENIPPELGKLSDLRILNLLNNNITGLIPPELGELSNLHTLYLNHNAITGHIPPELSQLSNMWQLTLSHNELCGKIPSELGNISTLEVLRLRGNKLSGEIPLSITKLTKLIPELLGMTSADADFGYNMLYSTDEEVIEFLKKLGDGKDWYQTQTISPDDLEITKIDNETVRLLWTPIEYDEDPGHYIVRYGIDPDSLEHSIVTVDKSDSTLVISDLALDINDYHFAIQTFSDAHDNNPNALTSKLSKTINLRTTNIYVEQNEDNPKDYMLKQNYPNPFNPLTRIQYHLPDAVNVNLSVYDVLGRLVAVLVSGVQQSGHHNVYFDASQLASGMYIYRITTDDFTESKQMILAK